MKCTTNGLNAKIFAKAVQSLSKYSNEVVIEVDQHCFQLRVFNVTQSAMGSIKFYRDFFENYQVDSKDENCCRISIKVCLNIFRNMKKVEHCELKILPDNQKLQILLKCSKDTIKTALIKIVDDENLTAAVSSDNMPNKIIGPHKTFTEISNNFNFSEEEITFETTNKRLVVQNYIEGARVNDKFMRSQLKLASTEFEKYEVNENTSLTFCLKEFRAFLLFAESLNESILLNFSESGSPISLKIIHENKIECVLIMSTLSPEDVSFQESFNQSVSKKRKFDNVKTNNVSTSRRKIADETTLSNTIPFSKFGEDLNSSQSINILRDLKNSNVVLNTNELNLTPSSVRSVSPAVTSDQQHTDSAVTFLETEENRSQSEHCIPQSPTSNQNFPLRRIFSRCFELTYKHNEPSPNSEDYAGNSD